MYAFYIAIIYIGKPSAETVPKENSIAKKPNYSFGLRIVNKLNSITANIIPYIYLKWNHINRKFTNFCNL